MEYQGPTPGDLANIHALNRFFLMAWSAPARDRFAAVDARGMTRSQIARLASAPFLLFSFREQDEDYWQRVLGDESQIDLIDSADPADEKIRQLQAAGLSFLWQLVHRNPYAARIVSGASVSWCERLAEQTLVGLLHRVGTRGDLMRLRFEDEKDVWRRLLDAGTSSSYQARLAAQHCALQAMLTQRDARPYNRVSAAACSMRAPGQRQAARRADRIRDPKV